MTVDFKLYDVIVFSRWLGKYHYDVLKRIANSPTFKRHNARRSRSLTVPSPRFKTTQRRRSTSSQASTSRTRSKSIASRRRSSATLRRRWPSSTHNERRISKRPKPHSPISKRSRRSMRLSSASGKHSPQDLGPTAALLQVRSVLAASCSACRSGVMHKRRTRTPDESSTLSTFSRIASPKSLRHSSLRPSS